MHKLFEPYCLKGRTLRNRIVFPPVVCFNWASENGHVTEKHIRHYEELAKGGNALIIIEATCVNKSGRLAHPQLGIWSDEHIEGLRRIGEACHKHGSMVLVQIHHAGFKSPGTVTAEPVSSSDYAADDIRARGLTKEELKSIQKDFAAAAKRAVAAGLDGVEIHGAHGYLISQFMSPLVNKRQDEYGGSLENRARFAVEIVEMIKADASSDFIIGYRMGGNEPTLENGIEIAKLLEKAGVDLLHVSAGIPSEKLPKEPDNVPYNWIVHMGGEIKKHVNIPVIAVNGIRTAEQAAYIIENGLADFVAVAKAQLADHRWVRHISANEETYKCKECPRCLWYTDGTKCPNYSKNL